MKEGIMNPTPAHLSQASRLERLQGMTYIQLRNELPDLIEELQSAKTTAWRLQLLADAQAERNDTQTMNHRIAALQFLASTEWETLAQVMDEADQLVTYIQTGERS